MARAWKRIVIHHSAGHDSPGAADFHSIRAYHIHGNGWRDIGYHFVVEKVSAIHSPLVIVGRGLHEAGAHAKGANGDSIGVCLVGDFTAEAPAREMLVAAARLCASLLEAGIVHRNDRTIEETVVGHRTAGLTPTECPGDAFPMAELHDLVREYLGEPVKGQIEPFT